MKHRKAIYRRILRAGAHKPHLSEMTRGPGGTLVKGPTGNRAIVTLMRKARGVKRGNKFRKSVASLVRRVRKEHPPSFKH